MARQHVEYKVPGTDKDSGEEDLTAIKPVADGEPAQASVFKRPSDNLRTRTEFIRDELENLKYLSDSDRALLLTSTGNITWTGLPTGTFTASAAMTLKPFLAPAASTASRLIIGANTASQITIRTRQDGATGQPRAYNGANTISFDFTPLTNNPILITVDGSPANNFHVRYDDNPATGTTNAQLIAALQANAAFTATWGLEAVMEGNGIPPEVGFPVPPAPVGSNKVIISGPEQLLRFMSGAAEAEQHLVTPAHITAFFSDPLNVLTEGDVLAVRYDDLVMSPTYGGRRQSLNEAAEGYTSLVSGANLFLVRRFPARIPLSLPIAAVVNGVLIFVNGRSFNSGETGPLVAAGASYQGSNANPNSWADNTGVAQGGPAITFEVALDTIIQTLGSKVGPSGAEKVGIQAIAGSPISTSAGGVHGAVSSVLAGTNAHIVNPTAAHADTAISSAAYTGVPAAPVTIGSGTPRTAAQSLLNGLNTHINDGVAHSGGSSILALINTFTKNNTFANTNPNTTAVTATGDGTGAGVRGTGGVTNGNGVVGTAAGAAIPAAAGVGVYGRSGLFPGTNGVWGESTDNEAGVKGTSLGGAITSYGGEFIGAPGTSAPGIRALGGTLGGPGVQGESGTTGVGVLGLATINQKGVQGQGLSGGIGVHGTNSAGGLSYGVVATSTHVGGTGLLIENTAGGRAALITGVATVGLETSLTNAISADLYSEGDAAHPTARIVNGDTGLAAQFTGGNGYATPAVEIINSNGGGGTQGTLRLNANNSNGLVVDNALGALGVLVNGSTGDGVRVVMSSTGTGVRSTTTGIAVIAAGGVRGVDASSNTANSCVKVNQTGAAEAIEAISSTDRRVITISGPTIGSNQAANNSINTANLLRAWFELDVSSDVLLADNHSFSVSSVSATAGGILTFNFTASTMPTNGYIANLTFRDATLTGTVLYPIITSVTHSSTTFAVKIWSGVGGGTPIDLTLGSISCMATFSGCGITY